MISKEAATISDDLHALWHAVDLNDGSAIDRIDDLIIAVDKLAKRIRELESPASHSGRETPEKQE